MTSRFINDLVLSTMSWQAFERLIHRLLITRGYQHVRLVGGSGDGGADLVGTYRGKRWLIQVKKWARPVGAATIEETINACRTYKADIPAVAAGSGFEVGALELANRLRTSGIPIQLWAGPELVRLVDLVPAGVPVVAPDAQFRLRPYQEDAVRLVMEAMAKPSSRSGLVVLATGLGKTAVVGEVVRRNTELKPGFRTLVLVHRNEIVYQLERALWPFLRPEQVTVVWNGIERPPADVLRSADIVCACVDSLASMVKSGGQIPDFDAVVVDECHHLGTATYDMVLGHMGAGKSGGPFLLGATATPWRPDGSYLLKYFPHPLISIDLVTGLQQGYLANVDYRMFTDNVDWERLRQLKGERFSPKAINRTLFIEEWDDAVVERIQEAWREIDQPRGIVFCGTIGHARKMSDRVNALGFTRAAAIHSGGSGVPPLEPYERSRLLWEFAENKIGLLCAVDILNEGVDLPDVNLVIFQRVTHSRRIFVQQLGRGLRLAPGKKKVIVLDFVSDVRRFAAGLELQGSLSQAGPRPGKPVNLRLQSTVTFMRRNQMDQDGASFLREWLGDLGEVEEAGEDVSVLRYPRLDQLPSDRRP
jgi:superfamily II DNA or RNA helicase